MAIDTRFWDKLSSDTPKKGSVEERRARDKLLLVAYRARAPNSFEALVCAHWGVLKGMALDCIRPSTRRVMVPSDWEDLWNEVLFGFSSAADRFDFTHENLFWSYALHYVRDRIFKFVGNKLPLIRVSQAALYAVQREKKTGEVPGWLFGARRGTGSRISEKVLGRIRRPFVYISLNSADTHTSEDEDFLPLPDESPGVDEVLDDEDIRPHTCARIWKHAQPLLRGQEATVLQLRFGQGLTLEECGQAIGGLTRERARQIESQALETLREILGPSTGLSFDAWLQQAERRLGLRVADRGRLQARRARRRKKAPRSTLGGSPTGPRSRSSDANGRSSARKPLRYSRSGSRSAH